MIFLVLWAPYDQAAAQQNIPLRSHLHVFNLHSGSSKMVWEDSSLLEAPNWSPDGEYLIFNKNGHLYQLNLLHRQIEPIETGQANHCNNDHGLSPNNQWLAISSNDSVSATVLQSRIYILPRSGSLTPRSLTSRTPSYWHSWSPDGRSIAYCAARDGNYDVYTISAAGGEEKRLTTTVGLDDGPDYSPDGRYIYFNSYRTGKMKIWRMDADGADPRQITGGENSDWFPHPSPNGKYIVFLRFEIDQGQLHPADKAVQLCLLELATGYVKILDRFNGGQGTINVPSWAPDSQQFAYMRYTPR